MFEENYTDFDNNTGRSETTSIATEVPQYDRNVVGIALYASALALGMVTAVFGNAMTLIAIAMHRSLQTKTSCFIASLAMADLLNGGTTFPLMLIATIYGRSPFTPGLCAFFGSLTIFYCCASVNTLAFVAIDRFFAIVDPLRYVTKVTSTFVAICITYSWVEGFWLAMMPIAGWSHYEYIPSEYICTADWAAASYTIFLLAYQVGVPCGVIFFCYARIFKVARDQSRKVAEQSVQVGGAKPASKTEAKAARVLFIVIGTFLTCWTPHTITMLCNAFTQNHCPIVEAYHTMTVLLAHTNSAMNPILYGVLNRQMRRAYYNVLKYCCRSPTAADLSLTDYSM